MGRRRCRTVWPLLLILAFSLLALLPGCSLRVGSVHDQEGQFDPTRWTRYAAANGIKMRLPEGYIAVEDIAEFLRTEEIRIPTTTREYLEATARAWTLGREVGTTAEVFAVRLHPTDPHFVESLVLASAPHGADELFTEGQLPYLRAQLENLGFREVTANRVEVGASPAVVVTHVYDGERLDGTPVPAYATIVTFSTPGSPVLSLTHVSTSTPGTPPLALVVADTVSWIDYHQS